MFISRLNSCPRELATELKTWQVNPTEGNWESVILKSGTSQMRDAQYILVEADRELIALEPVVLRKSSYKPTKKMRRVKDCDEPITIEIKGIS